MDASARKVDFDARLGSGFDAERAFEWCCQWWVYASSSDHDMRGILEVLGYVDIWLPMCGSCCWLESLNFEPEAPEGLPALVIKVAIVSGEGWEYVAWYRKALPIHQFCGGGSNVGL